MNNHFSALSHHTSSSTQPTLISLLLAPDPRLRPASPVQLQAPQPPQPPLPPLPPTPPPSSNAIFHGNYTVINQIEVITSSCVMCSVPLARRACPLLHLCTRVHSTASEKTFRVSKKWSQEAHESNALEKVRFLISIWIKSIMAARIRGHTECYGNAWT